MRTKATVVELENEQVAVVSVERRSACDGCHKAEGDKGCSVCTLLGGNREARARALNTAGATVGDTVALESRTGRILAYAAIVFLLPVLLGLVGYLVGFYLLSLGKWAIALAFSCMAVSFLPIWLYSRLVVSHRLDVEIVEILSHRESADRRS